MGDRGMIPCGLVQQAGGHLECNKGEWLQKELEAAYSGLKMIDKAT